jgi:hypothetical protein
VPIGTKEGAARIGVNAVSETETGFAACRTIDGLVSPGILGKPRGRSPVSSPKPAGHPAIHDLSRREEKHIGAVAARVEKGLRAFEAYPAL